MIAVQWIDRSDNSIASQLGGGWRLRRAASRALLTETIDAFGVGPYSVRRELGRRPVLDPATHHFSMSHSGNLTVCAVAERNVAVDVELLGTARAIRLSESPPARFFTEKELRSITADPARLVHLFTLKEAWSKYGGIGLGIGLGSFDEQSIRAQHEHVEFSAVNLPGAACTVCHHADETLIVQARALSASQVNAAEVTDRRERTQ
ncbi:4'-phosphopantetheinyl transferase superfamily protein [Cryobacterium sp. TMS1-13-1]|uniref:4'-phosphopantetheinyl transferase family protein n=1 Tax=Cryobacterium sp. TMS1-13-1 TaxID=1259220 RepID=UPI00106D46E0|nr:4'-phosphopantetheinyl transferase superfamily protein [Cryobacterium sp. TMS1-13-1]TFD19194.1 4'-phosphopantetheinyl transferase superfamily protein [Cryobacterium sp. TMS1-13-1]